jgi:hypothetical protein
MEEKGKCALMLNIPLDTHSRFKIACSAQSTTMTKTLINFMNMYLEDYEKIRDAAILAKSKDKEEDFDMITAGN